MPEPDRKESSRSSGLRVLVAGALALAVAGGPAPAQDMPVPIDVQAPLLLKVLKYEKTLEQRVGNELVIGIVFQKRFRDSLNARDGFVEAVDRAGLPELLGRPMRRVDVETVDAGEIDAVLERDGIDILYITPLRAASLSSVVEAADAHNTLTLSGVPDYVEDGVMVGVTERRNRPAILLNLDSASAAGVTFSSELLKVAQIVAR